MHAYYYNHIYPYICTYILNKYMLFAYVFFIKEYLHCDPTLSDEGVVEAEA